MRVPHSEILELLLRPAGGGVYLVSTGREAQLALQKRLYGAATEGEVSEKWREKLRGVGRARAIVLGIPSDVGAGFRRGANLAPQTIREALLTAVPDWADRSERAGIVDLGDVFVVPQLLHDEMLSPAQIGATRAAIFPNVDPAVAETLPVSPLSMAERVLDIVLAENPGVAVFVLGGDHSTTWPVVSALSRARADRFGIVQSDAHTDLLRERLGVRYCFATWSFHANEILGRGGRLVQLGIRASRHERAHWEEATGVRQFWADECRRAPDRVLDALVTHLRERDIGPVYFSNDIDGTDEAWASATGTPEPDGLEPDFVVEAIRRIGRDVGLLGGDVMEVAPPLGPPAESQRTVDLAVRYFRETVAATLTIPI